MPDEPEGPKGVPNRKGRYEGPDGELAAILERDVLETSPGVRWEHIAGLTDAKRLLEEVVVLPLWMPEYFQVQFVLILYCYFPMCIYITCVFKKQLDLNLEVQKLFMPLF